MTCSRDLILKIGEAAEKIREASGHLERLIDEIDNRYHLYEEDYFALRELIADIKRSLAQIFDAVAKLLGGE